MPMFTKAEMNDQITRSGKHIANKDHHSVPTSLRKAKTFLEDEYLYEIMAASYQHCFYFKANCCHSFRKNDPLWASRGKIPSHKIPCDTPGGLL